MNPEQRRAFLRKAILAAAATQLPRWAWSNAPALQSNPFALGVASGDPAPDGVVLWTRLVLADPATPVHLAGEWDCPAVRDWVTFHSGAPLVGAAQAMFAVGRWDALQPVSRFAIGDAVYSRPDIRRNGTYAEYVAVRAREAALKPATISHIEAASLPLVSITAWEALITTANKLLRSTCQMAVFR